MPAATPSLMLEAPTRDNTAAVVVLFHPEGQLVERLQRALSQVAWLVVLSNDDQGPQRLEELNAGRVTHIQSTGNVGLAAALNQGLVAVERQGFTWCLLLDQDTEIDADLIEGLCATFLACPNRSTVGVLAPNYRSPGGSKLAYPREPAWQVLETSVTSGSLVAILAVRHAGGMREAFFIEGIDIEFSLRIRAAGLQIIGSGRPLMTHGAGAAEERRLFGRTVLVGHHTPWRYFMQFRNLTWIIWRYWRQEPRWVRAALVSMMKRFCLVLLFEHQRFSKAWAMLRGTLVGLVQAQRADNEPNRFSALK